MRSPSCPYPHFSVRLCSFDTPRHCYNFFLTIVFFLTDLFPTLSWGLIRQCSTEFIHWIHSRKNRMISSSEDDFCCPPHLTIIYNDSMQFHTVNVSCISFLHLGWFPTHWQHSLVFQRYLSRGMTIQRQLPHVWFALLLPVYIWAGIWFPRRVSSSWSYPFKLISLLSHCYHSAWLLQLWGRFHIS